MSPDDDFDHQKRRLELFLLKLQIAYASVKIVATVAAGSGVAVGIIALLAKYLPALPH